VPFANIIRIFNVYGYVHRKYIGILLGARPILHISRIKVNMGPILNGYRDTACVRIKDRRHELRRTTRSTLQRVHVHKCTEVGGDIFENFFMRCARRRRVKVLSVADHQ
jgi:hypothetical protein